MTTLLVVLALTIPPYGARYVDGQPVVHTRCFVHGVVLTRHRADDGYPYWTRGGRIAVGYTRYVHLFVNFTSRTAYCKVR